MWTRDNRWTRRSRWTRDTRGTIWTRENKWIGKIRWNLHHNQIRENLPKANSALIWVSSIICLTAPSPLRLWEFFEALEALFIKSIILTVYINMATKLITWI